MTRKFMYTSLDLSHEELDLIKKALAELVYRTRMPLAPVLEGETDLPIACSLIERVTDEIRGFEQEHEVN